ncbi:hypothetical protein QBC39DRAFT_430043 [Podospora conica]|nr:hypothetical protein QBC39DRAFT_430043 [Schizothecium conicum]
MDPPRNHQNNQIMTTNTNMQQLPTQDMTSRIVDDVDFAMKFFIRSYDTWIERKTFDTKYLDKVANQTLRDTLRDLKETGCPATIDQVAFCFVQRFYCWIRQKQLDEFKYANKRPPPRAGYNVAPLFEKIASGDELDYLLELVERSTNLAITFRTRPKRETPVSAAHPETNLVPAIRAQQEELKSLHQAIVVPQRGQASMDTGTPPAKPDGHGVEQASASGEWQKLCATITKMGADIEATRAMCQDLVDRGVKSDALEEAVRRVGDVTRGANTALVADLGEKVDAALQQPPSGLRKRPASDDEPTSSQPPSKQAKTGHLSDHEARFAVLQNTAIGVIADMLPPPPSEQTEGVGALPDLFWLLGWPGHAETLAKFMDTHQEPKEGGLWFCVRKIVAQEADAAEGLVRTPRGECQSCKVNCIQIMAAPGGRRKFHVRSVYTWV